ncbi:hypothetical protein AB0I60_18870 [Actinosynnema sp. NPDC050436]|uniref:hypothetical protein n=1 Tax=Actinosynnema sp. NPDC050436 TaxID=3155659 RepID=UPI0033D21EE2
MGVDRLGEAARAAGLSATAARHLARAVEEPPPADRRCRVRLRYGQALALGQVAAALPGCDAYREAPDDALRTEAAVAPAKTHGYAHQLGESVRLLDAAIDRCADPGLRRQALAEQLLWATWWVDDPLRADRTRLLDRIAPSPAGDGVVERLLITLHAWSLVLRGRPRAEVLASSRRVLRPGVVFADAFTGMEIATITTFTQEYAGEAAVADSLLDRAIGEFEREGRHGTHLAFAHANRGRAALRCGRLSDAVADADIPLRPAARSGNGTPAEWFATGIPVEAYLARGEPTRAEAVVSQHDPRHRQDHRVRPVPGIVPGSPASARDRSDEAITALREVGRRLDAAPITNPAVCPWRFEPARALRHSTPAEAREIAATAHDQAEVFGDPATRGRALRAVAALGAGVGALEESARLLRDAPDRLHYLHTLADLGRALARSGHTSDARRTPAEALAPADDCGALALRADTARRLTALGTTPDRPRRVNALSPRLRRVAEPAAEGRSEAEIAHGMPLSLENVRDLVREAHAATGTTSRAELRRAFPAADRAPGDHAPGDREPGRFPSTATGADGHSLRTAGRASTVSFATLPRLD